MSSETSSETSSITLRLKKIPEHLKIFIVYSDDDIIVIRKPSLLRSVRGIANHADDEKKDKNTSKQILENKQEEEQGQKEEDEEGQKSAATSSSKNSVPVIISMQDAWVHAIRFYRNNHNAINASLNSCLLENNIDNVKEIGLLKKHALDMMINLASKTDETLGSISRRGTTFKKYVKRNRKTLLPCFLGTKKETKKCEKNMHHRVPKRKREVTADSTTGDKNDQLMDEITEIVFKILIAKTREIYSQATEYSLTKDEESADGQLNLLTKISGDENIIKSYGTLVPSNHETSIYVVHRLDCETSGIMVFARTAAAASFLSKAWRDRDRIVKKYVARVKHWPPFEDKGETSGSIHLAMAPMVNERIKWEIKDERIGGKPCETKWKVLQTGKTNDFVTLELIPVTGRTHQLRVHCAAIGSGIIGDSLYGENPVKLNDKTYSFEKPSQTLKLHAESLSFPHPSSNVVQTFVCDSHWIDE